MMTLTLLALAGAAEAAENEINLELGTQTTFDESWEVFSTDGAFYSMGGRIGVGLGEHLSLVAGFHRGVQAAEVYVDGWSDGESVQSTGDGFTAAFYGNSLALGPKLSTRLAAFASPYVTAQVMGQMGTVRLDADPVLDDDATQLEERAFAPGGIAAAGIDLHLPFEQRSWTPGSYVELGYGHTLDMKFDTLEDLKLSGVYFRWGVGVRF